MNNLNQELTEAIDALTKFDHGKLELGRRVKVDPSYATNADGTHMEGWYEIFATCYMYDQWFYKFRRPNALRGENIGRVVWPRAAFIVEPKEPELRHVLWALGEKTDKFYAVTADGRIGTAGQFIDHMGLHYDLTKSLYQQTDETKRWLLDLLT